ncbi:MAG: hypothetical protein CSA50_00510 [Gammaproteobacteria bacterium]|nr:MAG: hypothetical protein CSA50_00510 [Gammaproteobacteria bacterium]
MPVNTDSFRLNARSLSVAFFLGLALFVGVFIVFFPGAKDGTLVLDDLHVIYNLATVKDMPWLEGYINYLFQHRGYFDRPISYLTFYLQKQSLDAGLYPFKLFNIVLHAVNTVLVFALIVQILRTRYLSLNRFLLITAAVLAFLWAVSTIQVSTVLYATQRMTLLSATFSLLALLVFGYLRKQNDIRLQLSGLLFVVCPLIVLGFLCKENAFLVFLYLLVLDGTVYNKMPAHKWYLVWRRLFVLLPILLLVLYFVSDIERHFIANFSFREFDVGERFLTQHRIVLEYIAKFFFPFVYHFGVINTEFAVSHSFVQPISTSISFVLIWGAIFAAFYYRHKKPLLCFGVLFFFAGHAMESSVLSLELYFEHRNYLPVAGLVMVMAAGVISFYEKVAQEQSVRIGRLASLFAVIMASVYLIFVVVKTRAEVELWTNPVRQAFVWYTHSPKSQRAHSHLGSTLFSYGLYKEAASLYQQTNHLFPGDISKDLLWLELVCVSPDIHLPDKSALLDKAKSADYQREAIIIINSLLSLLESGRCKNLPRTGVPRIGGQV